MLHRSEIDGLRAVAVLPVVLFHAYPKWLPGGFVGVDVFFVISGYLITSIISSDLQTNTFSVLKFYERRIRRLFPALFTAMAVTFLAGAAILMPEDLNRLAESAVAAALFSANFFFWWTADYFGASYAEPFIHTWSLGVEEQFYLFYPLLLVFIYRQFPGRSLAIVTAILLASFVGALIVKPLSQSAAFYLPHLRAWELLLGAVLALGAVPPTSNVILREAMIVGGLVMIGTAVFLTGPDHFPGTWALLPCFGAALILYAEGPSTAASLLAARPLMAVGLISYSLYLWHWPVLELARYYNVAPLQDWQTALLLIVSFVAAYLSWRFIERPYRRSKLSRGLVFASGWGMTVSAIAVGVVVVYLHGVPGRFAPETLRYAAMLDKEQYFPIYDRGHCFLDYDQTASDYDLNDCAEPKPGLRVLIWGDSYAANLYPGLRQQIAGNVYQFTATSCRPLPKENLRCRAIYDRLPEVLEHLRPNVVIIAGNWSKRFDRLGPKVFAEGVTKSVAAVAPFGSRIILVGQSPNYDFSLPRWAFSHRSVRTRDRFTLLSKDETKVNAALARVAKAANIAFLDFYGACSGLNCTAFINGAPLHWDGGHMTREGSLHYTSALVPLIEATGSVGFRSDP